MNHGALVEGHVKSSVSIKLGAELYILRRVELLGILDPDTIAPFDLQSARGALVRSRGRGSESERSGQHGVT